MYTEHLPHALVTDCGEKWPYENMCYMTVTGLSVEADSEPVLKDETGEKHAREHSFCQFTVHLWLIFHIC